MRSLLLGTMVLGAFGCQTTDVRTNDGRALPPAPSAIPPPPAGITIDAMTLLVGQRPIDVDGDGYPDRIEAAVALFSEDYAAASLRVPGTFVFELVPRGADAVGHCSLDRGFRRSKIAAGRCAVWPGLANCARLARGR